LISDVVPGSRAADGRDLLFGGQASAVPVGADRAGGEVGGHDKFRFLEGGPYVTIDKMLQDNNLA